MSAAEPPQDKIIELSELTGGLAHEIRNPLSTLKVNLQLLSEDFGDEQRAGSMDPDLRRRALQRLATLLSETVRLQTLLDDFLNLVSRREIDTRAQDVNAIVRHLGEFFSPRAAEQGIEMRTLPADGPLICTVDDNLLRQALLNLCVNAQQAMPDGGVLVVSTQADAGVARIDVRDTGIGIEPETVAHLFQPFYSTKKAGSGLGLSLTRRIIAEHGGNIGVHSEPGKGSTFSVHLPLADGA